MMLDEHRDGSSKTRPHESDEARRVSKRTYVRPSVTCQSLEHAVQGTTGPRMDGGSGKIGKSQGGP